MIQKVKVWMIRIWKLITRPEMLVLPGQLAYFFLLAIVPTITLMAYGASFFHLSFDFLTNFMSKAFGSDVSSLIMPIVTNVDINAGGQTVAQGTIIKSEYGMVVVVGNNNSNPAFVSLCKAEIINK